MARRFINAETLSSIADAIRSKTGKHDPIATLAMASEIESIPTGGGGASDGYCVRFLDFDGSEVASVPFDAFTADSFPTPPDHTGDEIALSFVEWNWTAEEVLRDIGAGNVQSDILIGAIYRPTDGQTRVVIETQAPGTQLMVYAQGGGIDWGDGTGKNTDSVHTYANAGKYILTLYGPASGYSSWIINTSSSSTYKDAGKVKEVYFGSNFTCLRGLYGVEKATCATQLSTTTGMLDFVMECNSLKYLALPHGFNFSQAQFSKCGVERFSIPGDCSYLPRLNNWNYLLQAHLPMACESVAPYAFDSTYVMEAVSLGGVTAIPNYAFQYTRRLKSFDLSKVVSIGQNAFYESGISGDIDLPVCASIGRSAFGYALNIGKVRVSSSLTSVGDQAFSASGVKEFDGGLAQVTSLGLSPFTYCTRLKKVALPGALTQITASSFENCYALCEMTVPASVISISAAFKNAYSLNALVLEATTPPTLASSAALTTYMQKIVVPAGCRDAYIADTNWGTKASIIIEAEA